jgi:hypothetical protein
MAHKLSPLSHSFLVIILAMTSCTSLWEQENDGHPRKPRRDQTDNTLIIEENIESPSLATIVLNGPVLPRQIPPEAPVRGMIKERLFSAAQEFKSTLPEILGTTEVCVSKLSANSKVVGPYHNLITARIDYAENTCGNLHPLSWTDTFVVDLTNNESIKLNELFGNNLHNIKPRLSKIISSLLEERYPHLSSNWINQGTSPKDENFSHFLVAPDGLIVLFKDYQVAPHSAGVRELLVPFTRLAPLIKADSPLAPFISSQRGMMKTDALLP